MERRRSRRVAFKLKAESTLGDVSHKGTIENFSQEGMMKVIPNGQLLDILPGTKFQVIFETPSGTKLNLECEVRWVRHFSNLPFGIRHYFGMKIQSPPQKYKEFVHGLYSIHRSTALTVN
jgi:hypothetical protein